MIAFTKTRINQKFKKLFGIHIRMFMFSHINIQGHSSSVNILVLQKAVFFYSTTFYVKFYKKKIDCSWLSRHNYDLTMKTYQWTYQFNSRFFIMYSVFKFNFLNFFVAQKLYKIRKNFNFFLSLKVICSSYYFFIIKLFISFFSRNIFITINASYIIIKF